MISPDVILSLAGPWALVVAALIVFAETGLLIGFLLPGDSLVFVLGMMSAAAASTGRGGLPLWLVCLVVVVASFIGDQTGYRIGRAATHTNVWEGRVHQRHGARIQRAHDFFERHGPSSIILARFVPIVRTFLPFTAGMAGYEAKSFLRWNAIGALIWGISLPVAGYLLGDVTWIAEHIDLVAIGIAVLSVVPIVVRAIAGRVRTQNGRERPTA